MTEQQYDLFGVMESTDRARTDWAETLRGPIIPCPWDTQGGKRAGEPVETFQCPRCGGLELTDFCLSINHGTSLARPGHIGCWRTQRYSGAER